MTIEELAAAFEAADDEFLKFERVTKRRSPRKDLHAFLLLDAIVPPPTYPNGGVDDIVDGATHDEIWLGVDVEGLAAAVTKEQVIELVRCGVRHDSENNSLAMFV